MKDQIKDFGIRIATTRVTSANCNNITGATISGSVSYNPEINTLTLDNAIIYGDIWFSEGDEMLENITITLVGENIMAGYIETVKGTKIINGTGSLKASGIFCGDEQNTIIEDCTIDLYDNYDWVLFSGGDGSKLTIKNANILAETDITTAIGYFTDIELIGCEIVEPANAQITDIEVEEDGSTYAGKYICNEDGDVAGKVIIRRK